MSGPALTVAVLGTAAVVVAAVFLVMWRARAARRESEMALLAGWGVAAWALIVAVLAYRGLLRSAEPEGPSPVAVVAGIAAIVLVLSLAISRSLRRLLANQANLVRLHVWRLEGLVFLILTLELRLPVVQALPVGIADVLVGASAFWIAAQAGTARGRRWTIAWNLLGLAALILAIRLGLARAADFPLALVPAFLVPLACALHAVSLSQLLGGAWGAPAPAGERAATSSRDASARRSSRP